jgi:probable phosphoglycerate mutase
MNFDPIIYEIRRIFTMVLYVARHGETDYNVQKRYSGSTDVPLNAVGEQQAKNIAEKLADIDIDIIISSPLFRALKTAQMINAYHPDTPLVIKNEFAERNVGVFEGLTREEAKNIYPDLWARQCTRQLDDAPTEGETIRQVDIRVAGALAEIRDKYIDKTVLVVCHGFVSRIINRQINGLSFDEMHSFALDNCQVINYII